MFELGNAVLTAGNLVVAIFVLGVICLAIIGGVGVVRTFTAPEPPNHNEPRI